MGASFRENASKSKDVAYLGGPLTFFEVGTEVTIDRKHTTKILAWYASSLLISGNFASDSRVFTSQKRVPFLDEKTYMFLLKLGGIAISDCFTKN